MIGWLVRRVDERARGLRARVVRMTAVPVPIAVRGTVGHPPFPVAEESPGVQVDALYSAGLKQPFDGEWKAKLAHDVAPARR